MAGQMCSSLCIALIISWNISLTSSCGPSYSNGELRGYYCDVLEPLSHDNLTVNDFQACVRKCIHSAQCLAVNYPVRGGFCILLHELCTVASVDPNFIFMLFQNHTLNYCENWIDHYNGIVIPQRVIMGWNRALVRGQQDGINFIGHKVYGRTLANINIANTAQSMDIFQYLMVSPSCSAAWIPYSAGDQLPRGAVVADPHPDGPLYIMQIWRENENLYTYGYYNLSEGLTHFVHYGVQSTATMEILVWI